MTASGASVLVVPHLDGWAPQWDELVNLAPLPTPFLRSWWLAGAAGARPHFVLAVDGERLLGGLALEEERRLGLPWLRMMSAGPLCPDHLDLLASPGHEDAVAAVAGAWLGRPGGRVLDLDGVAAGARLLPALPGPVRCEPLTIAPWAALPADPAAYLAGRPSGFRKTLRKASARLAAEGSAHCVKRGPSAVSALETLRQLHTAQWGDRSRFLPSFGRFAAACRLGADCDEVAVHELAVAGTVIATMVVFEVAGRVSLYQSARLTDFRWRDATSVLLAAIISDACDRGFAEVDFLRGDEAYKSNFAPGRRELLRLRGASGTAGRFALTAESAARAGKRAGRRTAARPARFLSRRESC